MPKKPKQTAPTTAPPPEPPMPLAPAARAKWDQLVADLRDRGEWSDRDRHALAVLADSLATYEQAATHIAEHGAVVLSPRGEAVKSPFVTVQNQAFERIHRLASAFGLTPASRATIKTPPPAPPSLADLLK